MSTRPQIIVIAPTKEAGEAQYPGAAAIVTPRSSDAARGIVGTKLVVMASMRDHEKLDELLEAVAPSLATAPRRGRPNQVETVFGGSATKPVE